MQFNDNGAFGGSPNFVFTAQGNVGIGTSNPLSVLTVVNEDEPTARGISSRRYGNDVIPAILDMFKSRGTQANPLPVLVGDEVGYVGFSGLVPNPPGFYLGADVASIAAIVTGVFSNNLAGDLMFLTNDGTGPAGAGFERMRITAEGLVGIGTSNPKFTLDVNGDCNLTSRDHRYLIAGIMGIGLIYTGYFSLLFGTADNLNLATINPRDPLSSHTIPIAQYSVCQINATGFIRGSRNGRLDVEMRSCVCSNCLDEGRDRGNDRPLLTETVGFHNGVKGEEPQALSNVLGLSEGFIH